MPFYLFFGYDNSQNLTCWQVLRTENDCFNPTWLRCIYYWNIQKHRTAVEAHPVHKVQVQYLLRSRSCCLKVNSDVPTTVTYAVGTAIKQSHITSTRKCHKERIWFQDTKMWHVNHLLSRHLYFCLCFTYKCRLVTSCFKIIWESEGFCYFNKFFQEYLMPRLRRAFLLAHRLDSVPLTKMLVWPKRIVWKAFFFLFCFLERRGEFFLHSADR